MNNIYDIYMQRYIRLFKNYSLKSYEYTCNGANRKRGEWIVVPTCKIS